MGMTPGVSVVLGAMRRSSAMNIFLRSQLLVLAVACPLVAQPSLSVDALVADVTARHPEIAFYEAELAAAKASRRSAGALADPELSFDVGHKRVRDPLGALAGEGVAWSVSVAQSFEWPGRLALRKSIANRDVELAELGLQRFKAAIAARVRVLGYGLQAAAEKAAAAREVAERYQALRAVFVARDPAGVTPLLETRIIEAQEIALKRRATDAEIAHRQALAELNAMRQVPLGTAVAVEPLKLDFPDSVDGARLLSLARERNFEFRSRRVELEQQTLAVSLARHERLPGVTVSPFYAQERAGEREATAGVGISVPLPLRAARRSTIDAADARRRQAAAALQVAERALERDVLMAADTYLAKLRELHSWAPDAVSRFREAADVADRHYRLGAVPLATYVELQGAYLDAVEALLDTQREALEARLKLEELAGATLPLTEAKP